jgi:hypothetical protein
MTDWGKVTGINARWVGVMPSIETANSGIDFVLIIRNQNETAKWVVAGDDNTIARIRDTALETP